MPLLGSLLADRSEQRAYLVTPGDKLGEQSTKLGEQSTKLGEQTTHRRTMLTEGRSLSPLSAMQRSLQAMMPPYLETIPGQQRKFVAMRDPLRCQHRDVVTDPLTPSLQRAREELEKNETRAKLVTFAAWRAHNGPQAGTSCARISRAHAASVAPVRAWFQATHSMR